MTRTYENFKCLPGIGHGERIRLNIINDPAK